MLWTEKKTDTGWEYAVDDVFGTITIWTTEQLSKKKKLLDDLVVTLLKQDSSQETVSGSVTYDGGVVEYKYVKAKTWDDDDLCDDIPTNAYTRERRFSLINPFRQYHRILNWSHRFVEAFRKAWRNSK